MAKGKKVKSAALLTKADVAKNLVKTLNELRWTIQDSRHSVMAMAQIADLELSDDSILITRMCQLAAQLGDADFEIDSLARVISGTNNLD